MLNRIRVFVAGASRKIASIPTVQIAYKNVFNLVRTIGPSTAYLIPLSVLGAWMIFPCLGDEERNILGLAPSREVPRGIKFKDEGDLGDTMPIVK